MEITDSQLTKFQTLYQSSFGVKLSKKEASKEADALLNLVKIVYQPITKDDLDKLQKT